MGTLFKRAVITLSLALSATWLAHSYQGLILEQDQLDEMLDRLDLLADRLDEIEDPPPPPAPPERFRLQDDQRWQVSTEGWSRGPADAPVVIVEYVDLQCPFCKRAQRTLELLQQKYPEDIRLVFKHNPLAFHKDAEPAARSLECAGEQGRFWAMQDLLWENTRELDAASVEAKARRAELNLDDWSACLERARTRDRVQADVKEAKELGARGTPTFFINGRPLTGARPLNQFETVVDEELADFKASRRSRQSYANWVIRTKGLVPHFAARGR